MLGREGRLLRGGCGHVCMAMRTTRISQVYAASGSNYHATCSRTKVFIRLVLRYQLHCEFNTYDVCMHSFRHHRELRVVLRAAMDVLRFRVVARI